MIIEVSKTYKRCFVAMLYNDVIVIVDASDDSDAEVPDEWKIHGRRSDSVKKVPRRGMFQFWVLHIEALCYHESQHIYCIDNSNQTYFMHNY